MFLLVYTGNPVACETSLERAKRLASTLLKTTPMLSIVIQYLAPGRRATPVNLCVGVYASPGVRWQEFMGDMSPYAGLEEPLAEFCNMLLNKDPMALDAAQDVLTRIGG